MIHKPLTKLVLMIGKRTKGPTRCAEPMRAGTTTSYEGFQALMAVSKRSRREG
jgi:hypothetical protein